MKSRFRMGWILCMFDLPTVERAEQRQANRFRQGLLELGYLMLQESVYVRNCVSMEKYESHIAAIKEIAPDKGLVNAFFITNRQWLDSETIICPNLRIRQRREIRAAEKSAQQMTFW